MKYFFDTQLGDTRYLMADGGLLCKNVPIARTGKQLYSAKDLPKLIADPHGEIVVDRSPEEVFSERTMASFEGMSVTVLHPEDNEGNIIFVAPDNWRDLSVGHVQNVRRGEGEQSDLMIADLIVKDAQAIELIEDGDLRQVSCGYDAEYEQTEAGKASQHLITGNHTALVPKGRAGNRCKIGDKNTMAAPTNWLTRLRRAIKAGDSDTISAVMDEAPTSLTGDTVDLPSGLNLNINLPPQQPLPDKAPEMGGSKTADDSESIPEWGKKLISAVDALTNKTGDSDDDSDKSKTDDEASEEEKSVTGDAAYRADVIIPGIDLSRKVRATAFKREVLSSADRGLVRQIVGDANISNLSKSAVDMAFNAVSELAKNRNINTTQTVDSARYSVPSTIGQMNKTNSEFWSNRKG